jgi:HSP20 family protein
MAAPTIAPEKTPVPVRTGRLRFHEPLDLLDDLQQELARIWGQRPLMPRPFARPLPQTAAGFAPRLDVFEKNGNVIIKAELPGVDKKDITVTIEGGDLIIEGERKNESEVTEKDYYRLERSYGTFYRRLPMPFEVKAEQVKASYTDGVLEIQIPKPAEATPQAKKVDVR